MAWSELAATGPRARGGRDYVRRMRPFPLLAAMLVAAVLAGTLVEAEHWFGGNPLLVAAAALAAAVVAFNWCELWATRHDR